MIYLSLFFTAFISGSLLPLGSEGLLIYYIQNGYNLYLLLFSATLGNTLGATLNYFLGLKGEEFLVKKSLLDSKKIKKAQDRFKKYGAFALLLSPLPIIGDPITFIAGILKYNFYKFLFIVAFAKFIRYLFLALLINF